ncbi:MAG: efflux RND transporter periplasmic adaptor subunit [Gammaproteobacteria bacterium]|nr:efflux RND transporter periplasmic adaptor subunit [Gammaproteobacteria bacterium]MBU1408746.1 efflux RND transporter periplasmic adaptor subunit [Gammaproteobacteria bacterium]MBU1532888.1 efflux RND transporter periplasmic adaptor subunit [Gammaproteobacteria bacterium]
MRSLICLLALLCAPALAAPPATVKSRPLSELAIHPQREASAQAVSLNLAKLSAELAARIDSIPVEPGQRIAQGAVVAQLDCTDTRIAAQRTQAELESSQARLKLAQLQLQRSTELAAKNFISGDALDAKQTEVAVVAAEVRLDTAAHAAARRDVGKCTLRSPYPAIVEARLAQVGELASPGTPIVQLWDTSRLQLAVQLQADDADRLAQSTPIFDSQGREYAVKLLRVSPALNPVSRTREARFGFAKAAPAPGSSGVLRWRDPRPFVPADYLVRRAGRLGVFVVRGQIARFVPLLGAQEGRPAAADALAGDAAIVTDGRFALQDGMAVSLR